MIRTDNSDQQRIPSEKLRTFACQILVAAGVAEEVAKPTADGLWMTSLRGTDSHGLRLLPHYVAAVKGGRIKKNPAFGFERTSPSTGMLDADHGFGHAAGIRAMHEATAIAAHKGVGFVAVRNSSHCGAMAYFALEACRRDMIGIAFTHASPKLLTPGSTRSFFGINPVCFAAPMEGEAPFVFDSAPTALTSNKLKMHAESGTQLPEGVAADAKGLITRDPAAAEQLLPIGDYKGFGLAMVVDIFCGLLTGMPVGKDISMMYLDPLNKHRFLGQFYGAVRIDAFEAPKTFKRRLKQTCDEVRAEPWKGKGDPPMAPGDPEKAAEQDRRRNGIPLPCNVLSQLNRCAEGLSVDPISSEPEEV